MEWGFTEEEVGFPGSKELRDEFHRQLNEQRKELPRLTKAQADTIVTLMVDAYYSAQHDESVGRVIAAHDRSAAGVEARRRKAAQKRDQLQLAINSAAGANVSVEQLAKEHGVSRSTAYRWLRPKPSRKPRQ
jgi:hypothetical protein